MLIGPASTSKLYNSIPGVATQVGTPALDTFQSSHSSGSSRFWRRSRAFATGATAGMLGGALAMHGPAGFLGGVGLGTALAVGKRIDGHVWESAQTGLFFATLSATLGATLGVPGALTAGLLFGARAALGSD